MKLKVGDIEMDSRSGISFGDQPVSEQRIGEQPARDSSAGEKKSLLERLPKGSRNAYLMAAVAAVAAMVGLGALSALFVEMQLTWRFVPLVPVPGLMFAAGLALWGAALGGRQEQTAGVDSVERQRSAILAGHLEGRAQPASVEQLIDELAWREEAVVRGLEAGVRSELIVEDLDLDTGHWTYAAAHASSEVTLPAHALPVEQRARCLTSDE